MKNIKSKSEMNLSDKQIDKQKVSSVANFSKRKEISIRVDAETNTER